MSHPKSATISLRQCGTCHKGLPKSCFMSIGKPMRVLYCSKECQTEDRACFELIKHRVPRCIAELRNELMVCADRVPFEADFMRIVSVLIELCHWNSCTYKVMFFTPHATLYPHFHLHGMSDVNPSVHPLVFLSMTSAFPARESLARAITFSDSSESATALVRAEYYFGSFVYKFHDTRTLEMIVDRYGIPSSSESPVPISLDFHESLISKTYSFEACTRFWIERTREFWIERIRDCDTGYNVIEASPAYGLNTPYHHGHVSTINALMMWLCFPTHPNRPNLSDDELLKRIELLAFLGGRIHSHPYTWAGHSGAWTENKNPSAPQLIMSIYQSRRSAFCAIVNTATSIPIGPSGIIHDYAFHEFKP